MWLKDRGYVTSRWNDFGGGINLRQSNDSIDDKQSQIAINVASEGNKLITLPWYVSYYTPAAWVTKGQAITIYQDYVISLHNRNLYVFDTTTSTTYTKANAVANAVDIYSIITTKSFGWDISIVCINSINSTTEDIVWYEWNTTTHVFSNITFTSLANKNFKCGAFYDWKLLLGGNPSFPSSLYYSKTWSVAAPTDLYDFSAYSSWAQNIGDGEAITWIISNNSELFVFKTNSVWKNTWYNDTWADAVSKSFAYIFKQISQTWSINPHTFVAVEQDVLYFDWLSIRRLSYEQNMAALSDDSVSKDIESVFTQLPSDQRNNATMYYSYPFVKTFLKDKFSVSNSVGILYNVVDKSFSIQQWVEATQWVGWFISNKRSCYFVTSQTSTVYKDWVWTSYQWGNINVSHLSKRYVLGDWVDYKRISQLELYWKTSPLLTTYVDVYVNWLLIDTRTIYKADVLVSTTGSAPLWNSLFGANSEDDPNELQDYVERFEYFNDWRDFQFWIRSNWQWRFELHWLNLMYKAIKAYNIH